MKVNGDGLQDTFSSADGSNATTSDFKSSGYSTWLQRLYQSEFFNSRMALQYLYRYPDAVGTQYRTCEELKRFDDEDILFLLPQLCHLLVTQRSLAFALENFLLDRCLDRPHFAVLFLWQIEAYLIDYSPFPLSREYLLLKRIYQTIQALLILDDAEVNEPGQQPVSSPPSPGGSSSLAQKLQSVKSNAAISRFARLSFYKRKPTFSAKTAIVAASVVSGSIGTSKLYEQSCDMVRSELGGLPKSLKPLMSSSLFRESSTNNLSHYAARHSTPHHFSFSRRHSSISNPSSEAGINAAHNGLGHQQAQVSSLIANHHQISAIVRKQSTLNLVTSPSLEELNKGCAFISDYISQPATSHEHSNAVSACRLEAVLHSSYLRNQMQFVLALFDICGRLLPIPKPARQAALVAELALLNHNLPANICFPFWCSASHHPQQCHHKIVRISPEDAVTLNSADRVPYLMFVEIIRPSSSDCGIDKVQRSSGEPENPKLAYFTQLPSNLVINGDDQPSLSNSAIAEPPIAHISGEVKGPFTLGPVVSTVIGDATSPKSLSSVSSPRYSVVSPVGKNESPTNLSRSLEHLDKNMIGNRLLSPLNMGLTAIASNSRSNSPVQRPHSACLNGSPRSAKMSRDELDASLRSAAILLAQLHWELEKDKASVIIYPGPNPSSASNTGGSSGNTFRRFSQFLGGSNNAYSADTVAALTSSGLPNGHGSQLDTATRVVVPVSSQLTSAMRNRKRQQIAEIRARLFKEMMSLEEKRKQSSNLALSMNVLKNPELLNDGEETRLQEICALTNQEDPSAQVVQEEWTEKKERIRGESPYGHLENWDLLSVIVKGGTDLRQEQLATQLLKECQMIWKRENVGCWVYCFRVLAISSKAGFVETVKNAISVHSLKKDAYAKKQNKEGMAFTLMDFFVNRFGPPGCRGFQDAQDNFMRSLAAYSLFCYLFQVKDRHNGNILVDNEGHLIHIDFGFMLSNTPGSVGFEYAPFKLAMDYIDILGGIGSAKWLEFKQLLCAGLLALRKEREHLLSLVEMMQKDSTLNCFTGFNSNVSMSLAHELSVKEKVNASSLSPGSNGFGLNWLWGGGSAKKAAVGTSEGPNHLPNQVPLNKDNPLMGHTNNSVLPTVALEERFHASLSGNELVELVDKLVESAAGNVYTRLYDTFQYYANGIL